MNKAQVYSGILWRGTGVPTAALSGYEAGGTVAWPAFSSTSLSREVAEAFMYERQEHVSVLFRIDSKTCVDARGLSDKLPEEGVLCLPGARFKVVNRSRQGTETLIELEDM